MIYIKTDDETGLINISTIPNSEALVKFDGDSADMEAIVYLLEDSYQDLGNYDLNTMDAVQLLAYLKERNVDTDSIVELALFISKHNKEFELLVIDTYTRLTNPHLFKE